MGDLPELTPAELGALLARTLVEKRELEAENARLRAGIQSVLDGDYPNPRSYRPGKCPHGQNFWEDCGCCTDDALAKLISSEENSVAVS